MILVEEIIKNKNAKLFDKCRTLDYVLDVVEGPNVRCQNKDFSSSIIHSEILSPIAYSNDKGQLLDYAKNNNLKNYRINNNPCKI